MPRGRRSKSTVRGGDIFAPKWERSTQNIWEGEGIGRRVTGTRVVKGPRQDYVDFDVVEKAKGRGGDRATCFDNVDYIRQLRDAFLKKVNQMYTDKRDLFDRKNDPEKAELEALQNRIKDMKKLSCDPKSCMIQAVPECLVNFDTDKRCQYIRAKIQAAQSISFNFLHASCDDVRSHANPNDEILHHKLASMCGLDNPTAYFMDDANLAAIGKKIAGRQRYPNTPAERGFSPCFFHPGTMGVSKDGKNIQYWTVVTNPSREDRNKVVMRWVKAVAPEKAMYDCVAVLRQQLKRAKRAALSIVKKIYQLQGQFVGLRPRNTEFCPPVTSEPMDLFIKHSLAKLQRKLDQDQYIREKNEQEQKYEDLLSGISGTNPLKKLAAQVKKAK